MSNCRRLFDSRVSVAGLCLVSQLASARDLDAETGQAVAPQGVGRSGRWFQYLVGNTEYSSFRAESNDHCCHNADLMSSTGDASFTPLPYDFDSAGIVNAPYTEPSPRYKLRSVRQRLYKGLCKNNDLLPLTLQLFQQKKDEIYGIVDELEQLNRRSRRYLSRYLNEFYDRISKPKSVERLFIRRCNETR